MPCFCQTRFQHLPGRSHVDAQPARTGYGGPAAFNSGNHPDHGRESREVPHFDSANGLAALPTGHARTFRASQASCTGQNLSLSPGSRLEATLQDGLRPPGTGLGLCLAVPTWIPAAPTRPLLDHFGSFEQREISLLTEEKIIQTALVLLVNQARFLNFPVCLPAHPKGETF